jgi:hypothetical protein
MAPPPGKPAATALTPDQAIAKVRERFETDNPEWYSSNKAGLEIDWERLGCATYESRNAALKAASRQISPEAWDKPVPPGTGIDRPIHNVPIYQWVYECDHFKKTIFFRFAFSSSDDLYIVSIHPDDYPKK